MRDTLDGSRGFLGDPARGRPVSARASSVWQGERMPATQRLDKRKLIREHAEGLSYVDVGGLWGTKGETVTTAALAGASRCAMADIQEPGNEWWSKFADHCAARGVQGYEEIHVDVCAPDGPERIGTFDFVHCAGVMYHVPDLFGFVGNLVAVTGKYLMLSSVVMPDEIHGSTGTLAFGPDHAYLTPILTPENKQVVKEYLDRDGRIADGITTPGRFMVDARPKFGPWWWLFSGAFMSRLVRLYGLEVLAEGATPSGQGYTVFARVPDAG
jgi:hypothetical protein